MHEFRNILIIRLSSAGDVACAIPLIGALRRRFPEARLSWVVNRAFKPLLEGHPELSEIFIFDRRRPGAFLPLALELRRRKFDLVIDAQGQLRSGLLGLLSGAPVRIGFEKGVTKEPNFIFLSKCIAPPSPKAHNVERFLSFASDLGADAGMLDGGINDFKIVRSKAEIDRIEEFLSNPRFGNGHNMGTRSTRLIGVSIAGSLPNKRWPESKWAKLIEALSADALNRVILLWGPGEETRVREITSACKEQPIVAPPTSWKELSELISRLHLFIGNDSGPLHIAALLGVRTIGLFGPTDINKNGPYGKGNLGLRKDLTALQCYAPENRRYDMTRCRKFRSCKMQNCMNVIDVDEVALTAARVIQRGFGLDEHDKAIG